MANFNHYPWLLGHQEDPSVSQAKTFALQGKKTLFYGYTPIQWVITVAALLGIVGKFLSVIAEGKTPFGVIIFVTVFTMAILFGVFALNHRRTKYFKDLQEQHKGKEFFLTDQSLFISAGEFCRGEVNAQNFVFLLLKEIRDNQVRYIEVPFSQMSNWTLNNHVLDIYPLDSSQRLLSLTMGDKNQDRPMHEDFRQALTARKGPSVV